MTPVLDTCAIAEAMRADRNPGVAAWFAAHPIHQLATTAMTVTEVVQGVERLPEGKRKAALKRAAKEIFANLRILDHTFETAQIAGGMIAAESRAGRTLRLADACIAAIALEAGAPLVTRDADFNGVGSHPAFSGFRILNPWGA